MIPHIPGAVRRMAADTVGVFAEGPQNQVLAVRENAVILCGIRKEAGQVCRAATGQADGAACRQQAVLLFRRDADVGRAVHGPDGDGFSLRKDQVSVGVSGNLHLAGDCYVAAALNALIASGDGAAVHGQRAAVCHAGAGGGGDGAACHGESAVVGYSGALAGGDGAAADGQRAVIFNAAGKGAVLQGKAAAFVHGHVSGNGATATVSQGEAACHGHVPGDAVAVQAEGHVLVHLLPGIQRHVAGQVVAAGIGRQGIAPLPRVQFLFPMQVGDQAVIAAAVIIDPAVGGVRHREAVSVNAVRIPGEVLPPDAVQLRLFAVELVGHLAGGKRRFVCDRRTGNGGLAVILEIVAVFHDAVVGAGDGRCGGKVASGATICTLEPAGDIAVLDQAIVDKGDAAHQVLAALAERQGPHTAVLDNALAFVLIDDAADVLFSGPVQRLTALNGSGVEVRDGTGGSGYIHTPVVDLDGQILYGAAAGNAAEERVVLSAAAYPQGDRVAVSVKDAGIALDGLPRIVLTARNILYQHGVQAALAAVYPLTKGFQVVRAGDLIDLIGLCRSGFGAGLHGGLGRRVRFRLGLLRVRLLPVRGAIFAGGLLRAGFLRGGLAFLLALRFRLLRRFHVSRTVHGGLLLRCGGGLVLWLLRKCRCWRQRHAQRQYKEQACDAFFHVYGSSFSDRSAFR